MKEKILKAFKDSIAVKEKFVKENIDSIIEVSRLLADTFNRGDKLLLFGNGGSASDASHIAAEFVNRFRKERPAFPAVALNTDMAVLTSIANDYDYADVFVRQLKALAREGDVVIAISTSGNSPNVIKAVEAAKRKRLKTIAFTGAKGDKLASKCDYVFSVPSGNTPRVQETHITLGHVLCQMVEELLFEAHRNK
ncbi:MAG: D-sedoheptulose 7-phosphate isomerase [Thermodesulfovibrionia bacterium]|jgi:D-sedoheptulose 7-phosphate isomerase|nr:D-sedoheptulose 7-phosphate isomerase [Thermodesulfovibrionia bacterium]